MNDERVKKVYREIYKICRDHDAERILLFGSRAKGTALPRSDIDIAVYGVSDLGALKEDIYNIRTLYTIDIVGMDNCTDERLIRDIEQYGREISEEI